MACTPPLGGGAWGGQVKEVSLPASDPLVLAAGGTQLSANPKTGAYIGETAWPNSGGGFSHLYARPAYQDGVPGISKTRGVPDVAGDADAPGGLAQVYTSDGAAYLDSQSGTSCSAPLWAGIMALADEYAHRDLGFVNPRSTTSAEAPATTRPFTTLRPASTVTRRLPDGTR